MSDYNDTDIYNGILKKDTDVLEFLVRKLLPVMKEYVDVWIKFEKLAEKNTDELILRRIRDLRNKLLAEPKSNNQISVSQVTDFCCDKVYKHLFEINTVFECLRQRALHFIKYIYQLKKRDREAEIEDICMEALENYYEKIVLRYPDSQVKCSLNLFYTVLYRRIMDWIRKHDNNPLSNEKKKGSADTESQSNSDSEANDTVSNYLKIYSLDIIEGKILKDLEEGGRPDEGAELDVERKKVIEALKEIFGNLLDELGIVEIDDIIQGAIDLIYCFIRINLHQICIQHFLLLNYGFKYAVIREIMSYDDNKDTYKTILTRCRKDIKDNCLNR